MTTRERRHTSDAQPVAPTEEVAAPESGAGETGDAFLRAADLAMERALSGSPEAFLEQNEQLSGQ